MVIKNLSVKTEHDQCITTHYNKNNDLQGLSDFVTVQRQVSPYQAYGELFNRYTQRINNDH